MIGVLHTWGRQPQFHSHLHFIVPGGGLQPDGLKWRSSRQPGWLLPQDAVAAALRDGMQEALRAGAPDLHAQVPDSAWREGWWVHFQPAGSGRKRGEVPRPLRRPHRASATSASFEADDEAVRFTYTDTHSGEHRECTLSAEEFMRRYLQHVLPPGQHRVRYLGGFIRQPSASAPSSKPCWRLS